MKTLILTSSPNKKGNTAGMVDAFVKTLNHDYEIFDIFRMKIHTCMDCGKCMTQKSCQFNDDFIGILNKIEEADVIVLASPVWFADLNGPLLTALSRVRILENQYKYKDRKHKWDKAGVLLLSTGTRWDGMSMPIELHAEFFFRSMDALPLTKVYANHTDDLKAHENPLVMKRCEFAAQTINEFIERKAIGDFIHYGVGSHMYDELEDIRWVEEYANI